MKNTLSYREYLGSVEYSDEDQCLHGKILGIKSLVSYEADDSVKDIKKAFMEAVDEYIEYCKDTGVKPERTYNGTINIRISPELHRDASCCAAAQHISLNKFIEQAIEKAISKE